MLIWFISDSSVYSLTSCPPMVTLPLSVSQNRAIRLQKVVLPLPEGPMMAVVVLSGSVTEMSRKTGFCSYEKFTWSNTMSCLAGVSALPCSSMRGMFSVSTVRSIAAAAIRSMDTPMPNALIWLNTKNDITSTISAVARLIPPPIHSSTAASIMPTLAICSTASCSAV